MKKHYYKDVLVFLFLFVINISVGFGQDAEYQRYLDSLETYLNKKDDSLKLVAISDLAWEYNSIDVDRSIQLSFKGISIAQKLNRKYAVGRAYADLGTSYYFKRDFDSAAYCYNKSLDITKMLRDSVELAFLYNKMGALYKERAEFQESLKHSFSSLKIYQKLKDSHNIALLYNNIGVTYEEIKNYTLAEAYYQKSLAINKKEQNKGAIARNYIGLGNIQVVYRNMDEAYDYFEKAAAIFRDLQWGIELSVALNNMGDALDIRKRYAESIEKRKEALKVSEEIGDVQGQAKYNLYIADVFMKIRRFSDAFSHIQSAEKLSATIQSHEIEMDLYELYSKYYFGTNNFEKGSDFLNKFHSLKDSIYSTELSKNIASMEVKHNTQQLKLEKAETEAKNLYLSNEKILATQQRNYVILATSLLLFISFIIFYLSRQKLRLVEERKRINAMLQSEEEERRRIARDLHDGLGQILSTARIHAASLDGSVQKEDEKILKTAIDLIDESIIELRGISHNLMPQVLSENGLIEAVRQLADNINLTTGLQVQFTCSTDFPKLEKPIQVVLYRIVQEIVNNMMKHAQATIIQIKLDVKNQHYSIQIEDNGLGFDLSLIDKSEGIGWRNIKTRVSLINVQFHITSTQGKGTKAVIEGKI